MRITLAELAERLGFESAGDGRIEITGLAEPAAAGPGDLAIAFQPRFAEALTASRAEAALLWAGADWRALGLRGALFAPRPRLALAGLTQTFDPAEAAQPGIHPSAVIAADAELGPSCSVAALAVIAEGARIGEGAVIGPHVSIGPGAVIGRGTRLGAGARIGHGVRIGDRVRVQPNAVIGADGFSYETVAPNAVEEARRTLRGEVAARSGSWARIHSLGGVVLGDDVEIGAGTTIDRGTLADTVIGRGTKIDNLVQIGHNCRVGEDCLLCGQVGLAGSVTLGDRVVLAGKVGVADHRTIGSDVVVGGGSAVRTDIRPGRAVLGDPAIPIDRQMEIMKALRRLPRALRVVTELKKAVSKAGASD